MSNDPKLRRAGSRHLLLAATAAFLHAQPGSARDAAKPTFQEKAFWDKVYERTNSSENDWFQQWRHPSISRKGGRNLADVIMPHLSSLGSSCSQRLLHIGCGTSSMPEQMLQDGFAQQVCIDISEVAMSALTEKFRHLKHTEAANCGATVPSFQFLALDATRTGFESSSFDVIIDKGTLDAQMGGPQGVVEVAATLDEAIRLLRIGGMYVQISHSEKRCPLLEKRLDDALRPWQLAPLGSSVPHIVLAPVAYTGRINETRSNDTSSVTSAQEQRRRKDATYIYIYRKTSSDLTEL